MMEGFIGWRGVAFVVALVVVWLIALGFFMVGDNSTAVNYALFFLLVLMLSGHMIWIWSFMTETRTRLAELADRVERVEQWATHAPVMTDLNGKDRPGPVAFVHGYDRERGKLVLMPREEAYYG